MVATVIIYVIGLLLAILQTTDAATDRGLARVVLAQITRIRQDRLQELDRNDLLSIVHDRVDTSHTDILDHTQVCQVLLAEGHPETGALDRRVVLRQALQLLVIHQVGLSRTHVRVVQRLVHSQRIRLLPLAILPVFTTLGDLADIDLRIEVRGESLVVITGVAIHDV